MTEARDTPGVIAPPPLIVAVHLLVGLGLDALWPAPFLGSVVQWLLAVLLIAPAVILALWCLLLFRRAGTAVEPWHPSTVLVTGGPYRFSRNPIYLAMVVAFAGLACAIDSLWLLALLPVLVLGLDRGVICREEPYLARRFGTAYRDYCDRLRRWL
jgi:protein-S-isoprenylcysteine O-methyltransferase Ste14